MIQGSIKRYHDVLFEASVTDKDKMYLTAMITLLTTTQFMKFETDYENLILKSNLTPAESIVELSKKCLETLNIDSTFKSKIIEKWDGLKFILSLNTPKNGETKCRLIRIIEIFLIECYPYTQINNFNSRREVGDFLGQIFAVLNGQGANGNKGIVLTPYFLADFMVELLEIDYKTDVILDGACGTASFLIAAYTKMISDLEDDFNNGKISAIERKQYLDRINKYAIYGNDNAPEMAALALMNFALMGEDIKNIRHDDFFNLDGVYFDTNKINKGILNPPFEYEPAHFALHMIERIVSNTNTNIGSRKKFVMICPQNDITNTKKNKYLTKILNLSTLEVVVDVQDKVFRESLKSGGPKTAIFVFDLSKPHSQTDKILYLDFTDSGYEYFKDSGLIDKNNTFEEKKNKAIDIIKNRASYIYINTRDLTSFFDIQGNLNFNSSLDLLKISRDDVEEIDISKANREIKLILEEKQEIIDKFNNKIPNTEGFEDYIVNLLSGVND